MNVPTTARRVPDQTAPEINQAIDEQMRCNVAKYSNASPRELDQRLRELDAEWDVERVLEANASIAMLASIALGTTVSRKWFALSAAIAGFLLMHAIQGWCPPLPILRRMGFRTSYEIDQERYALKAIRGDFAYLDGPVSDEEEIEAIERFESEGGLAYEEPPVARREVVDDLMAAVRG